MYEMKSIHTGGISMDFYKILQQQKAANGQKTPVYGRKMPVWSIPLMEKQIFVQQPKGRRLHGQYTDALKQNRL